MGIGLRMKKPAAPWQPASCLAIRDFPYFFRLLRLRILETAEEAAAIIPRTRRNNTIGRTEKILAPLRLKK